MFSDLFNRDYDLPLGVRIGICLAAFIIAALPIVLVDHLSFVDYPNHFARFYIWQNLEASEHLSTYYERQGGLHPYWGVRLFINGLSPLLGLDMAARAFVIVATLMPAAGACCVGWVLARRVTLLPLGALAVSYNFLAGWGFQNFLFASGMALMVFALWIVLGSAARWQRVAVIGVLAGVLAVMHLLAAALLGLIIGAWELATLMTGDAAGRRLKSVLPKAVELAAIFVLPAVFYFTLDAASLGDSTTDSGGLLMKFISLVSPFVMFGTDFEALFSAIPLLIVFAAIGGGIITLSRHAAIFLGVMAVVTLVAPYKLFGVAINWRIPLFAVVLVFAVAATGAREAAARNVIAIVIALSIPFRVGDVTLQLRQNSGQISELVTAGETIERGSRVLPVYGQLPIQYLFVLSGDRFAQYGAFLVPTRQILFPLLFPYFDVGFRAPYSNTITAGIGIIDVDEMNKDEAFFAAPENWHKAYAKNWRQDYDYLLVFGSPEDDSELSGSELVHQGSYFQIRKIAGASVD